jgi:hypothetical protein
MHLTGDHRPILDKVRDVFAQLASDLAPSYCEPLRMEEMRKPVPERSYLLFCPEQGGWLVGRRAAGDLPRWIPATGGELTLQPTHWMPSPRVPA